MSTAEAHHFNVDIDFKVTVLYNRIMENKKNNKNIKKPAKQATPPLCPYISECGSCQMLDKPYTAQLNTKTRIVSESLAHAGIKANVNLCVGIAQFGCRNKTHLAFTELNRHPAVGFFNDRTHKVVPVKSCPMHGDWFASLAATLAGWADAYRLDAYKPWFGKGLLRFAVARHIGDTLMLTVVATDRVKHLDKLYNELTKIFPNVVLYQNINTARDSAVFSDRFTHVAGNKKLAGELLGVKFLLSPNSFFQVNEAVAARIYTDVLDAVKKTGASTVVDAYSGIGVTSMLFAGAGSSVISVELEPRAVEDAKELSRINDLSDKIKFICGDCAEVLPKLRGVAADSVFFVDPPRRGLGHDVCRTIIRFSPKNIIYLSCNPETLADDLRQFAGAGYTVNSVQPYDMFPNTGHVECVVLMSRERT
jgi:23S rRNA (uracil1939-C5)-methyltransferase